LKDYLAQDRQWLRPHRIAHAKYQLRLLKDQPLGSVTEPLRKFWQSVVKANAVSDAELRSR
jgi:hypothetical protein